MSTVTSRISLVFQSPGLIANVDTGTSFSSSFLTNPTNNLLNWEEYSFESDFLTTCDAFSFKIGDPSINQELYSLLVLGHQPVQLQCQLLDSRGNVISGTVICSGYTDPVEVESARSGRYFTIHGRNQLGQLCDAGINPWNPALRFVQGMNLGQLIGTIIAPYNLQTIYTTDSYNRQITSGVNPDNPTNKYTTTTIQVPAGNVTALDTAALTQTQQDILNDETAENETTNTISVPQVSDPTNIFDLTQQQLATLKPKVHETKMQFMEKHCARFHCHIWASNDGLGIVVGQPDYIQTPVFTFNQYLDGGVSSGNPNNVLNSKLKINPNMPSAIVCKAMIGSGDTASTRCQAFKVNELNGYFAPASNGFTSATSASSATLPNSNDNVSNPILAEVSAIPGLLALPPNNDIITNYSGFFKQLSVPNILYIDETGHHSGTQDQVNGYIRRTMSEHQKNGFVYTCQVQDHQQNGYVFKHNMIAIVNDEVVGIVNTPMWIQKCNFKKSRLSGTITELTLIPVGSIVL